MDHNQSSWHPPPPAPSLGEELHLWLYDLDRHHGDFALLSAAERSRAARLVQTRARAQYVAAQALLRATLSHYLGEPPEQLSFQRGPHGKPFLDPVQGKDLRFNLSHSGTWLLLAVARSREVGVDLEVHRPVQELALARRFFCAGEVERLQQIDDAAHRRTRFFDLWTAKEALVKAIGTGLARTLNRYELRLEQDRVHWRDHAGEYADHQWHLQCLPAPPGCSATLAAEGTAPTVRLYRPGA